MNLIIGVLGRPKFYERDIMSFSKAIIKVIVNSHNIPLGVIPSVNDVSKPMNEEVVKQLHKVIDMCDGIILQGGSDYYPYDMEAIKYIDQKGIPVLGICLGMQSLGAAFGSSLVSTQGHQCSGINYAHSIDIDKLSKLYRIIGKEKIVVNSRHNEMIINPLVVKPVAYNNDVIEAVEKDDRDFFIGVQWHPEDINDIYSENLFNAFFAACQHYHEKLFNCENDN